MKSVKGFVKLGLALISVIGPVSLQAQPQGAFPAIPGVPNMTNPNENKYQHQTHFLTFLGSYVPETAASAKAYYAAIDPPDATHPEGKKPTFQDWLVNAGFIGQASDWHPYGPQTIVTGQPAGVYGDNIINADTHVIVLNAADLGFVRNQFIRCKPSCAAKNPIIYTYLENYPVSPFTGTVSGTLKLDGTGLTCAPNALVVETVASCFPTLSGYPTPAEADAAINSAINRPLGEVTIPGTPQLGGLAVCTKSDPLCVERIADVAFEWAPPASNTSSSTRYGQLYAYIFSHPGSDASGNPITIETTDFPASITGTGATTKILDFTKTDGTEIFIQPGDKFAPNLDGIGFKQHPGVCLMCHGGKPTKLTSTGAYPNGGNINGFRFLPLDNRNLLFALSGPFSQASQEPQIKRYNQDVLLTIPTTVGRDGTGAQRQAHIRETIIGWYAADDGNPYGLSYSNDTSMSANKQNADFIPKGWRDVNHGGTAPAGAEDVYKQVLAPSCRSCHFNRELSLDFGTYANFHQNSDMLQLTLLAECKQNNPDPKAKFMPAAHGTFQRYWQTQSATQYLSDGFPLFGVPDRLANDFSMGSVAGYCATNP
jgi:hypothetical protein